jgi:hypothetical protein
MDAIRCKRPGDGVRGLGVYVDGDCNGIVVEIEEVREVVLDDDVVRDDAAQVGLTKTVSLW